MNSSRRPRAADVAQAAGVSTATVSYVLNNTAGQTISLKTQEKVRRAAMELGYVSNVAAQTLARGRSSVAVVDLSDFVTEDAARLSSGPIAESLRALNYEPFLTWWPPAPAHPSREEQLLQFARATRPELVLTLLPLPEKVREDLYGVGVGKITSFGQSYYDLIPAITAATGAQIEYLHQKGHEHVLFVGTADPNLEQTVTVREAAGKMKAAELGVQWSSAPRYTDIPHLIEILRKQLKQTPEVSAIAAYNDDDALSALFALYALGIDCPEDMALIGIDNETFTSRTYPRMTTVTLDFGAFGGEAISKDDLDNGKLHVVENALKSIRAVIVERESA